MTERSCRICGCTDNYACVTAYGACYWTDRDLCSACADRMDAARAYLVKMVWFDGPEKYDMVVEWALTQKRGRTPSLVVTGPSCSGKTELMKAVETLLTPDGRRYQAATIGRLINAAEEGKVTLILDEMEQPPHESKQDLYKLMKIERVMLTSKDLPPEEVLRECLHLEMCPAPEGWTQGVI